MTTSLSPIGTPFKGYGDFSGKSDAPAVKTVTCTLVTINGTARPNLFSLSYAWFDETDPNNFTAPTDTGETETTDGTGEIVVNLTSSTLVSGQQGTLVLRSDDGVSLGAYNLPID